MTQLDGGITVVIRIAVSNGQNESIKTVTCTYYIYVSICLYIYYTQRGKKLQDEREEKRRRSEKDNEPGPRSDNIIYIERGFADIAGGNAAKPSRKREKAIYGYRPVACPGNKTNAILFAAGFPTKLRTLKRTVVVVVKRYDYIPIIMSIFIVVVVCITARPTPSSNRVPYVFIRVMCMF